jgi:D-glycero-D-manno-heptose 1,7-bisphosphate phosphatase
MEKPTLEFSSCGNPSINHCLKSESKPAVFLDRDGTIIEDRDYLRRREEVVIFPGAAGALKQLQAAGFLLFIVSNQSGVGRGYFTLGDVEKVNRHLAEELAREGVRFEKIYFAPEAPEQPSRGRKPSPQFLFDARDEFGVDLARSFMIGDKLIDVECGWNAGVKQSLLVRTGYGAKLEKASPEKLARAVVVNDLAAAAKWILIAD